MVWDNENNSVTDVIGDVQRAKAGDIVHFTTKSPTNNGRLVAMVEKDDGILDYYAQPITSYAPRVAIPIKANYYPNFYTKIFLIGTQPNNPLPVYKRGMAMTRVDTNDKKLSVKILAERKESGEIREKQEEIGNFRPRDRVSITVQVTDSL